MKSTSVDIPVHDIAPLLEIKDHSGYWFLAIVMVVWVVILVFVKQMRMRKKLPVVNEREVRYARFIRIDMSDPKAAAYAICKQGAFFAHDNEELLITYRALFKRLEPFKYAPKVEPMDEESLALYKAYCQMIVV